MVRSSWVLRLSLLCLIAVLALPNVALADARSCGCEVEARVLPADGARDVPLNTKIWAIDGWNTTGNLRIGATWIPLHGEPVSSAALRVERFDPPRLDAGQRYEFENGRPWTTFSASGALDTTPPPRPRVGALTLTQDEAPNLDHPVAELSIDATFDLDAALLHIAVVRADGSRWSVLTTPDGIHRLGKPICGSEIPGLRVGDRVLIELSAIDLAGNEGAAIQIETRVMAGRDAHQCTSAHVMCGMGDMMLYLFGSVVLIALALAMLVIGAIRGIRRRADRDLAIPVSISLLVVEQIARALQRRGGVTAAIGLAGVPGMLVMGHELGAIPMTVIACIGIRGYALARSVLRRIEHGSAQVSAEIRAEMVHLHTTDAEIQFYVPPRILGRARRAAVPFARRT